MDQKKDNLISEKSLKKKLTTNQIQRVQDRAEAVLEVASVMSATLEHDALLEIIMNKVTDILYADRSSLFLVDDIQRKLWSKIIQGEETKRINLPLGKGVAGWCALTGEVLNIKDAYDDKLFNPEVDQQTGYKTNTILCVPLVDTRGRIVGVIQALNKKQGHFTIQDQLTLEAIASQAAISLENAKVLHAHKFF